MISSDNNDKRANTPIENMCVCVQVTNWFEQTIQQSFFFASFNQLMQSTPTKETFVYIWLFDRKLFKKNEL